MGSLTPAHFGALLAPNVEGKEVLFLRYAKLSLSMSDVDSLPAKQPGVDGPCTGSEHYQARAKGG